MDRVLKCLITFLNTSKFAKNSWLRVVFSILFSMFENRGQVGYVFLFLVSVVLHRKAIKGPKRMIICSIQDTTVSTVCLRWRLEMDLNRKKRRENCLLSVILNHDRNSLLDT